MFFPGSEVIVIKFLIKKKTSFKRQISTGQFVLKMLVLKVYHFILFFQHILHTDIFFIEHFLGLKFITNHSFYFSSTERNAIRSATPLGSPARQFGPIM